MLLWIAAFVALSGIARAETPPPATPPQVSGQIEYVGPDTYILLDDEGRPQPVLGMSYKDFVETWKKAQQVASRDERPRFTIERFSIQGTATEGRADLAVELSIRLHSDEPARIPLGMAKGILREPPRWDAGEETGAGRSDGGANGNAHVSYDRQQGGYVADVRGKPNDLRTISFQMIVPLVRDGSGTSLQLNCPRALVGKLVLDVPSPVADVTASEGTMVAREISEDGGVRILADGLAGDLRVTWTSPEVQRPELATVLSATGAIGINIDGHSIRSNARLTVRSYGGSFDRFRVRLPPGARLIQDARGEASGSPTEYRLTIDDKGAGGGVVGGDGAQVVLVELLEKQFGPIEVELATEQPLGLQGGDRAEELGGFEVLDSVRQFGDVALHVADDWQPRWVLGPHVRQVDRADLSPLLADTNPTASFQYDRQPWSLPVEIVTRPLQVHVLPEYNLQIGTDEARMRVHLTYQVTGARTFEFRAQLNGWELTSDPIESNALVDRDGVIVTRDDVLVLPLSQASPRRAEVTYTVRRDVPRDVTQLRLPLPAVQADSASAAELNVSGDPAVEFVPALTRLRGLAPTPISSDATVGNGRQEFRYRSFLPDAVFVADRTIRASQVTADVATRIELDEELMTANQTIDYFVQYQPVEQLAIEIPDSWSIVDDKLEIGAAGESDAKGDEHSAGDWVTLPVAHNESDIEHESRFVQFALPQPRMGRFRLRVQYQAASPVRLTGSGSSSLPLAEPVANRLTEHRVAFATRSPYALAYDATASSSNWSPVANGTGELELQSRIAGSPLPLIYRRGSAEQPQAVQIERVWLQTWQAGNTVQDRAAFRFRGVGSAVVVELPPSVLVDQVEVLLDGETAKVKSRENGRLTIDVSDHVATNGAVLPTNTLELRYRRAVPNGLIARRSITPPQMIGNSALSDVYWQIVLPGNVHVVRSPEQWVAADQWQWWQTFWGRRPLKSQRDLEAWVGATSQTSPTDAQNEYLYSGLATVGSIEITTAPRWVIVLGASGVVLVAAMTWMYLPLARRPWIVVALAFAVAGLAVAYPTAAVLLGQASLLGCMLAMFALVLRRWLGRPELHATSTAGSTNLQLSSNRPGSTATLMPAPQASRTAVSASPLPSAE